MVSNITKNDILIGQIYDMNVAEGFDFPTPDDCAFQFGFCETDVEKVVTPHMHKRIERVIDTTSEFLFVIQGRMTIEIYDENESYIDTVELTNNQALLQFVGGHKITIHKDTKYFELKQGPYFGQEFDKYIL